MTDTTVSPTDRIIRKNMIWAMGAGAIPVPVADVIAFTAIQLDMLRALCMHYDVPYSEERGKSIVSALTSSIAARYVASSFKLLPGVGTLLGGASMVVLSGASTYAVGKVFDKYLSEEGSLDAINLKDAKIFFKDTIEKGKTVAKVIRQELREKKEVA